MKNSSTGKVAGFFIALVVLIGIAFLFIGKPSRAPAPEPATVTAPADQPVQVAVPAPRTAPSKTQAREDQEDFNPMALPSDKVEAYLEAHHRDARSLLAALHGSGDTNYLREAAMNFPDDPRVQYSVLMRDLYPEERRKWLERFKTSSPGNSLPNYLSAADYFKNNQADLALAEVRAATEKPQFENYAVESQLNAEELCTSCGMEQQYLVLVTAMSGIAADCMPELQTMKHISTGIADQQKLQLAAGDAASLTSYGHMGIVLADQLRNGDSGKWLIRQMVGNASEAITLQQLDPNTPYDFLGGATPAQRLEALKKRRAEIKDLVVGQQNLALTLSPAEQNNYAQRMKIYGEFEAMRWLKQQRPVPATGGY